MLQAADLTIRLNPADDVVIARVELPAGTTLSRRETSPSPRACPQDTRSRFVT